MLIVCTGTGTEVGKTWIGGAVLGVLRRAGVTVGARKPVQSFDPADPSPTDAEVLARSTGEEAEDVCLPARWLGVPMAPPMAAEALGQWAAGLRELVDGISWPGTPPDVRWVESVGGVRSPLATDGDTVDLCRALSPDLVVLVADAGLGTINLVRMSVEALRQWEVVVVLNRFDPADPVHVLNRAWLADHDDLLVVTSPAELGELIGGRLGR